MRVRVRVRVRVGVRVRVRARARARSRAEAWAKVREALERRAQRGLVRVGEVAARIGLEVVSNW